MLQTITSSLRTFVFTDALDGSAAVHGVKILNSPQKILERSLGIPLDTVSCSPGGNRLVMDLPSDHRWPGTLVLSNLIFTLALKQVPLFRWCQSIKFKSHIVSHSAFHPSLVFGLSPSAFK